jgi:hypothetical protein
MNEGRKYRVENVHRTLHFGAFPQLSLPWKRNNTILFTLTGVYVAINNTKMFIFAMEMQQCFSLCTVDRLQNMWCCC